MAILNFFFLKRFYCENKLQKSEKLKKIKLSLILYVTPQLHTESNTARAVQGSQQEMLTAVLKSVYLLL